MEKFFSEIWMKSRTGKSLIGDERIHAAFWLGFEKINISIGATSSNKLNLQNSYGFTVKNILNSDGNNIKYYTVPQIISKNNDLIELKENNVYLIKKTFNKEKIEITDKDRYSVRLIWLKKLMQSLDTETNKKLLLLRDSSLFDPDYQLFEYAEKREVNDFSYIDTKLIDSLSASYKYFDDEDYNWFVNNCKEYGVINIAAHCDVLIEKLNTDLEYSNNINEEIIKESGNENYKIISKDFYEKYIL